MKTKKHPAYVDAHHERQRVIAAISAHLERAGTICTNKMHLIKVIALRAAKMHIEYGININQLSERWICIWFNRISVVALNKVSHDFSKKNESKELDAYINEIKQAFNLKTEP